MKTCVKCNQEKDLKEFSKKLSAKDGYASYCKACHNAYVSEHYIKNKTAYKERAANWVSKNPEARKKASNKYARNNKEKSRNAALKRIYGLTLEEFNLKSAQQKHKCAICGNKFKSSKDANMDHCHDSGKNREILCGNCNKGLGLFKDSIETLLAAAQYLTKHKN